MKKWMLVIGCAALAVALFAGVGTVSAWDDDDEAVILADEQDALAHALRSLCATQDCPEVFIPPPEPKVSLDTGGLPFDAEVESECEDQSGFEEPDIELPLDDTAWGDCEYFWGDDFGIVCTPDEHVYYVAIGMQGNGLEATKVVMCYYNEQTDQWEEAGGADFGVYYKLIVEGAASAQSIQIVRKAQDDENCPTMNFTQRFDYTFGWWSDDRELQIKGNGGLDYVYGSQFSDWRLEGERVAGRAGDDKIYLDNDSVTYPQAWGGYDDDVIYGTGSMDYAFGDGDTDGWSIDGYDEVYGYANTDYLYGQGADDILVGGEGRDWLFGDSGDYDVIWPDNVGQNLSYIDTCYGGSGMPSTTDKCKSCESRPYSDCDPS